MAWLDFLRIIWFISSFCKRFQGGVKLSFISPSYDDRRWPSNCNYSLSWMAVIRIRFVSNNNKPFSVRCPQFESFDYSIGSIIHHVRVSTEPMVLLCASFVCTTWMVCVLAAPTVSCFRGLLCAIWPQCAQLLVGLRIWWQIAWMGLGCAVVPVPANKHKCHLGSISMSCALIACGIGCLEYALS